MNAQIIADSIYENGTRLTTFEVTVHRFIWPEFLTYRVWARNAASSRARPIYKVIEGIEENLAEPLHWGTVHPEGGMQAGPPLEGEDLSDAQAIWREAAYAAIDYAQMLADLDVSKEVVNRILEPYSWHTAIITGTDFQNFFTQRCDSDAQAEIREPAELMRSLYEVNAPQELEINQWHLPYIQDDEFYMDIELLKKVSAARCGRVSYLTHAGKRDTSKDLELFDRLVASGHWSPLEHVARPKKPDDFQYGPLIGWRSLRHDIQYAPEVTTHG